MSEFWETKSDVADEGMRGDWASRRNSTVPVSGTTEGRGGGGLDAGTCRFIPPFRGGARITGSGTRKEREAPAQYQGDERGLKIFAK